MDISSLIISEQKEINDTIPIETKEKEEISNVQEDEINNKPEIQEQKEEIIESNKLDEGIKTENNVEIKIEQKTEEIIEIKERESNEQNVPQIEEPKGENIKVEGTLQKNLNYLSYNIILFNNIHLHSNILFQLMEYIVEFFSYCCFDIFLFYFLNYFSFLIPFAS